MAKPLLLYTFIRCPWAMRARLALNFMQIKYTPIEVDLKNKPQSLLDASPKGTVPVLILPNGKIIDESLDIILWAMPAAPDAQQAEIRQLIHTNDHEFKICVNRYKYPERHASEGLTQIDFRLACENILQGLESNLAKHAYLINEQISIADIAVFPLVRQFSIVDREWFAQTAYPNIQRWLETISNSKFYLDSMQKI